MKTLTINHSNGNKSIYQLIPDGHNLPIAYKKDTPQKLVSILENCRINRIRIKINIGNTSTGKSWNEEHDIMGYIGLSKGNDARYPILVFNNNSHGGGALLDHCILKITTSSGGKVLYVAENYKESIFEIKESEEAGYTHSVYIDDILYSNHKDKLSAIRLINKLK